MRDLLGPGIETMTPAFSSGLYPTLSTFSSPVPPAQAFPPPSSDWHRNRKLCGPRSSLIHRGCPWYLLFCHLRCFQRQCLLPHVPSVGMFSHDCRSVGIWAPALEAFCCNQWLLLPGVNITFHWGPRPPNPQSPNLCLALRLQPFPALQPPSQIPMFSFRGEMQNNMSDTSFVGVDRSGDR